MRREYVRQAEEAYAQALEFSARQGASEVQVAARLNRGILRGLSGDPRAEADFQAAVELRPSDEPPRLHYGHFLLDVGRLDEAIQQADAANSPQAAFLACLARYERNRGDDREVALGVLAGLATSSHALQAAQAVHLSLDIHIEAQRWGEAEALLARSGLEAAMPAWFFTLRARLCLAREDRDGALKFAAQAKGEAGAATPPVLRSLAHVLVVLGRDEDALPILELCVRPGRFDVDTRRLLDCANRLQRHEVVLRVCRELREAGEEDRRVFDTEVNLLQLFAPAEAASLLQGFLHQHPEDRLARLWLSFLGLRLGNADLVNAAPSSLPAAADVSVPNAKIALAVLHRTGQGQAAMEYAYTFLRRNFDCQDAHGMYVSTVMLSARQRQPLRAPGTVAVGSAVCYVEDGREGEVWLVVEDDPAVLLPGRRDRRSGLHRPLYPGAPRLPGRAGADPQATRRVSEHGGLPCPAGRHRRGAARAGRPPLRSPWQRRDGVRAARPASGRAAPGIPPLAPGRGQGPVRNQGVPASG